jgi:DNA polymerase III epsilon subunit-like protein
LVDVAIAVPRLFSPLTEYTQMTADDIAAGIPLEDVREMVRAHVGPHGILVGHSVEHDINWLELVEGVDYESYRDTAQVFAIRRPGQTNPTPLSLQQVARGLLEKEIQREGHSSLEDARISMRLYLEKGSTQDLEDRSREILSERFRNHELRRKRSPVVDGVCMGSWNKTCPCGNRGTTDGRTDGSPEDDLRLTTTGVESALAGRFGR